MDITTILSYVSPFSYGMNWLDIAIIFIFLFYAFEGYELGFFHAVLDLISFITAFFAGLRLYHFVGNWFFVHVSIPVGFANIIGFFLVAFAVEIICSLFLRKVVRKTKPVFVTMGEEGTKNTVSEVLAKANAIGGIIPGLFSAFLLLSFLLSVIIALPFSPFLKQTVSQSKIGNMLVVKTQGVEKVLDGLFGQAIYDSLNFLTVEPKSDETLNLKFTTTAVSVDENAEKYMIELVNKEREKAGVDPLEFDPTLRELARSHSRDMFARGFFSHYTPEGLSPFDRMARYDISFLAAGENLALAPNTELAMQGLMNSPGHKANILSKDFGKIGIGVIDGGIYGEMFTQEFTD